MTLPDRRNVTSPHHGHYPAGTDHPSSHENRLPSQALSPTETVRAMRTPPPTPSMSFIKTFLEASHVPDHSFNRHDTHEPEALPPVPRSRVTHPPTSMHPTRRFVRNMRPDGSILRLPGGPSTLRMDTAIDVDVDRGHHMETQPEKISLQEAESLRIVTQSPTSYSCGERCRERENLVPRGEGTPTVVSFPRFL